MTQISQNRQRVHSEHRTSGARFRVCLLAHDIHVPMNVGSFFRIADALGVERIYLTGASAVPPNAKLRKTSRSTEKYVPYEYAEDPMAVIERLRAQGYRILSLEITTTSTDITTFALDADDKVCLILGSESGGVPQSLLDASDACVHIPMLGVNSSMNVANACSIATFELTRRLSPCLDG